MNCYWQGEEVVPLDFLLKIEEKNLGDNYLSAGEMPLPALYEVQAFIKHFTIVSKQAHTDTVNYPIISPTKKKSSLLEVYYQKFGALFWLLFKETDGQANSY